jgi:hypothetical protein
MRDLRELSKLPDAPAYWVELEARMRSAGLSGAPKSWWSPFASRAGVLSGIAAAAGIAALLLLPPRTRNGTANPAVLFRLPDDPTMAAFIASPEPPSVTALMGSLAGRAQ